MEPVSKENDKKDLHVIVHAPRTIEPKEFVWAKTMKVGDAANEAAASFGYEPGTYHLQTTDGGRVLDNNKPLVAEHVKDGDELDLVAGGGGV